MQLYPTRATFQVALAGAAMIAVGVAAKLGAAIAFGGAMLLAVTLGRALALSTVTRVRASGFEMVWTDARRVTRAPRGGAVVLEAELRNRSLDDARGVNLRPIVSSMLEARAEPAVLDLPAGARVRFDVHLEAPRVGRWGVHGIALEVRGTPLGGEGLYEVPLMFANPHGVEVVPRPLFAILESPRGGRSRAAAEAGRPSPVAGDGEQLKELREHVPGDPFKRIAWKASARRGRLLVREMEREDRDVVFLLLDASVELWAGEPGRAPLDLALDALASVAARHLTRGDKVGLGVYASRTRSWLSPDAGPGHAARLSAALVSAANLVDADRCELEEIEIASRVAEHLRPLDPRGLADVARSDLDSLAARAEAMRARAPFAPRPPVGASVREQRLRQYLAAFGVEVPPRVDGERDNAEIELAGILDGLARERRNRPSVVHVWAPAPGPKGEVLERAIRRLRARRVEIRWTLPAFEHALSPNARSDDRAASLGSAATVDEAVRGAVRLRVRAAQARDLRTMRVLGVRARPESFGRRARQAAPAADESGEAR